jgi:hypothetical protein
MITTQFDMEWQELLAIHRHGLFEYADSLGRFSEVVSCHFDPLKGKPKYGVYVVRQKSTNEVLYVGKGGTIDNRGIFRRQDIPGRLRNVRANDVSANEWYGALLNEKGPLLIEYVFLGSRPVSPGLAEARLLQAYLNDHGHLPPYNKEL